MKVPVRISLLAALLLGPASAAQAGGPKTLVVREGLTAEALKADGDLCLKEAKAAERGHPVAPVPAPRGVAEAAATGAVMGALKGLSDMERFVAADDACLDRLGYRQVELTDAERKEFGAQKGEAARLAYIVEFSRRALAAGR